MYIMATVSFDSCCVALKNKGWNTSSGSGDCDKKCVGMQSMNNELPQGGLRWNTCVFV